MIISNDKLFKSSQFTLALNTPLAYPLDNNSEYVIIGNVYGGDLWISIGMSIGAENALILKDGSTIKIPTPQTLTLECRSGIESVVNIIEFKDYDVGLWLQPEVSGCDCDEFQADSAIIDSLYVTGTSEFDGEATFNSNIIRDGASASARGMFLRTNGLNRWSVVEDQAAESGSNAGSNLDIRRYDDTGVLIDTPMTIIRDTGQVEVSTQLRSTTAFRHTGTQLGVFGAALGTQPTITGSRGGNAALADLLTKLAALGFFVDGTSA